MIVTELIEALLKIEDKTIEVAFFCVRCKELKETESMEEFRFIRRNNEPPTQ